MIDNEAYNRAKDDLHFLIQPPLFLSTKLQCKVFLEVCMPVARERWEFIVYVGAAVFVFTCKMLIFVLMAEGWLQDSGPINFFWDQIGPSILRSHVDDRLYCECSTMTRLKTSSQCLSKII